MNGRHLSFHQFLDLILGIFGVVIAAAFLLLAIFGPLFAGFILKENSIYNLKL